MNTHSERRNRRADVEVIKMKEKKRKAKEIIERARHSGGLLHVAADTDLPMNIRVKAVQKIIEEGSFGDLCTIERDKTLPKDLKLDVTKELAKRIQRTPKPSQEDIENDPSMW